MADMDKIIPGQSHGYKLPSGINRLYFVDNLRTLIIILVIVSHLAITYGSVSPWYYVEPTCNDGLAYESLSIFLLVNQSYLLGLLFLISGYFTPEAYDRKGPGAFLKSRLLRLGIPLIVFTFLLNPLTAMLGRLDMSADIARNLAQFNGQQYLANLATGPMWFVLVLLYLDFGYVVWRMATQNRLAPQLNRNGMFGYASIGVLIITLALVTHLLRIVIPVAMYIPHLWFFGVSYLPQYLCFFILGVIAYRRDWFRRIPFSMGVAGFGIALAGLLLLFPLAVFGRMFSLDLRNLTMEFMGGGDWQSGVYTLWDTSFAVGMSLGLITLFRKVGDRTGKLRDLMSRQSYTVYFTHTPIIVLIAVGLHYLPIANLPKFGLAAVLAVPLCFGIAYLVRKIPFSSRIL
jgi:glucans biosynthesis protein C